MSEIVITAECAVSFGGGIAPHLCFAFLITVFISIIHKIRIIFQRQLFRTLCYNISRHW